MAGENKFNDRNAGGLVAPGSAGFAITPGAGKLDVITRAIYFGVSGDLTVRLMDDADDSAPITFVAVPQGTLLPIRAKYVTAGPASLIGLV